MKRALAVVAAIVVWIKDRHNRPAPPPPPPPPMQRLSNLESDGRYHGSRIAGLESQLEEMRYENRQLEERVEALEAEDSPGPAPPE